MHDNCEFTRKDKRMSDPNGNDPRDERSDNEHPINTGHPAVAPDGQYPPLDQTIGQMTGAVAPLAGAGVFTSPSGSRDSRNQAIVQLVIKGRETIVSIFSGDDDEPAPAHAPTPVAKPTPTPTPDRDGDDDDGRRSSRSRSGSRSGSSPTPTPEPTPKPKRRSKVVTEDPGSFG